MTGLSLRPLKKLLVSAKSLYDLYFTGGLIDNSLYIIYVKNVFVLSRIVLSGTWCSFIHEWNSRSEKKVQIPEIVKDG